jgi:chemotaxis protein histidine kinase CheA
MVRKDFILQNYVGTGGKCDARAVRCHERIARWHAMCEHQLSHIPDFVKMQSQQNIQELGQTMKTLNQYYDDSLGRSAIEVPDDEGKETITSWKSRRHGCASNQVMGLNPVDFDGSLLSNDPSSSAVSRRLIGTNPDCPTHGTAEPEMRGLYILLTINNEGGMEVLRYAAYLFRERPEVYHSTPVQLALRIYKAKKEYNYARFFSILRSPSTPYLFACIMFKHVQEMRKVAFRIMSKTYGAKRKDTGEAVYDAYPLRHLVKLLCFEDEEEARTACRHFNITIKEVQMSSSSSPSGRTPVEVIFWRQSDYREPKDPEKGFALPLYPKKMIRTIEAKLKGTTRLGVCRGEVSGDGAALSQPVIPKNLSIALTPEQEEERRRKAEEARKAAKKASEDRARQLAEQEAKLRMEEKRRQREEKKRLEEEKLRLVEMERQKREEERLLELERRAEEERRQEEAREAARIAAEKAAAEERRRQIEEAKRRAAELELARKKAEARELERKRQEELMRQHEEQSRLERLRIEEEERKRKEAEREHQRLLEVRRQQEAAEQRRREEKARKLALAWEQKINDARKLLLWKRLRLKLERNLQRERSRLELRSIDPVFSPGPPALLRDSSEGVYVSDSEASLAPMTTAPAGVRLLELLAQEASEPFDLSTLLRDAFDSSKASPHRRMVLVKLAVILPDVKGPQADLIQELAHAWIGKRLQYGVVETWTSMMPNIVGVDVMVTRHGRMAYNDYDAALLVIPPYFGVNQSSVSDFFPSSGVSIPKVLLDLDDGSNASYSAMIHDVIRDADTVTVLTTGESQEARNYDEALWESCSMLLKDFVQCFDERQTRSVERVPLFHLAVRCIRASLWRDLFEEGSKEDAQVYAVVCSTLEDLVEDLDSFAVKYEKSSWWGNWPSAEFAGESGHSVPNFFGVGIDLPLNWNDSLRRDQVEPEINLQFKALLNDSFADIIDEILDGAPSSVRASCHDMIAHRQFRRCMEIALVWKQGDYSSGKEQPILYLPPGADSEVVARFSGEILEDQPQPRPIRRPVEAVVDGEPSRFEKETYVAPEQRAANLFMAAASTPTSVSARNADENVRTPASTVGVETPQSAITPAGVETPQVGMAPIGVETPLTVPKANIGSSKRARNDSEQASPGDAKRRQLSICQDESNAFTKKLESLLQGESTYNLKIGDSNLTDLLQDVPSIDPPDALQRSSR